MELEQVADIDSFLGLFSLKWVLVLTCINIDLYSSEKSTMLNWLENSGNQPGKKLRLYLVDSEWQDENKVFDVILLFSE